MWKNPIFICTYFRPFSHWNSDESNGHGHILYYSPLLRGRFSGLLHDMQVYYAAQIMGASLHTSFTNLRHLLPYSRHRRAMGLCRSPFFHIAQLTALTTEVLGQFHTKNKYHSYVDDIYLKIMQYAKFGKRIHAQWNIVVVHNVIMNYANKTKSIHVQYHIDMTQRTTRHRTSNERHSLIATHLRRRALPFDRGPTWSRSIPRGLKKRHSTCLFSMTLSNSGPEWTLPFDRGPHGSRSVYGERNSRHTPCLSSRSQTNEHMKHTDSCLHPLTGVHLRRRALPFDRGPKRHDTASGEIPLEKILQQSTGVPLQQKALPFDRGPERPRPTNGELLHQYIQHVPLSPRDILHRLSCAIDDNCTVMLRQGPYYGWSRLSRHGTLEIFHNKA